MLGMLAVTWYSLINGKLTDEEIEEEVKEKIAAKTATKEKRKARVRELFKRKD